MADSVMFADYVPRDGDMPRHLPPAGMLVRAARPEDAPGIARLQAQREGLEYAEVYERRVTELRTPPTAGRLLLVAVLETGILAYGRAKLIESVQFAPDEAAGPVPLGWYLTGLIVDPQCRRQGIGEALTRERLEWISQRASVAFYFANARNGASIDLHQKLGFEPIQRDFRFPGARFKGGLGILFSVRTERFFNSKDRRSV